MKVERENINGELVIRAMFGHWSWACLFLIAWLSIWSFGCYKLAVVLIAKPFVIKDFLFALPFFAGEILVGGILILMMFGRTVLTFGRDGGTKFTGVGKIGMTKEFSFPPKGEIATDEQIVHGSKGGRSVVHRLVVRTSYDLDGPRVIYSSPDGELVYSLSKLAKEVARCSVQHDAKKKTPEELAAEEDSRASSEMELLSAKPPKGVSVKRDFEGRIHLRCRRIKWLPAIAIGAVMSGFSLLIVHRSSGLPIPFIVGLGFCMLFPLWQLLFALSGRCVMTLDHGAGVSFSGVGPVGVKRRFSYGGPYKITLRESDMWINGKRMNEIVIAKPGGWTCKICASWPNDVKPYLVALLRHGESVAATF